MFNKEKDISKYFNIPYTTIRDWNKSNTWRKELLEKLDIYMLLEEKAINKIKNIFTKEELQNFLGSLIRADMEVMPVDLIKQAKNAILYDEFLTDIEKKVLLNKLEELCNFEIYTLIEALYRFNRGKEFNIEEFVNAL